MDPEAHNGVLNGKRIVLGITGGIAAYKSCDLVRRLGEHGAQVRVVMTKAAQSFVSAMTFQALSGHSVRTDLLDPEAEAAMGHIELARWADMLLIAPATANCIAGLAQGLAEDLLGTLCLASSAPLLLAPAMNQAMWRHPATIDNVQVLRSRGVHLIGPEVGDQACGDVGPGRMAEVDQIVERIVDHWVELESQGTISNLLSGTSVLVTAGPTYEDIDPVRFVGNRSSGKMGYAVAQAAVQAGAHVTLVSGPTALDTPAGVTRVDVRSAQQMYDQVMSRISGVQIFIAAAAVADYRVVKPAGQKIKKSSQQLSIELERNPDILAEVAARSLPPFSVGFAAETEQVVAHARAKLNKKNLDMIAANQVGNGRAFDQDQNALTVLWSDGQFDLPMTNKNTLAAGLIRIIADRYHSSVPAAKNLGDRAGSGE